MIFSKEYVHKKRWEAVKAVENEGLVNGLKLEQIRGVFQFYYEWYNNSALGLSQIYNLGKVDERALKNDVNDWNHYALFQNVITWLYNTGQLKEGSKPKYKDFQKQFEERTGFKYD